MVSNGKDTTLLIHLVLLLKIQGNSNGYLVIKTCIGKGLGVIVFGLDILGFSWFLYHRLCGNETEDVQYKNQNNKNSEYYDNTDTSQCPSFNSYCKEIHILKRNVAMLLGRVGKFLVL